MDIKKKTALAAGAAVIGVGAALGVGYAVAGTSTQAQSQAGQPADGSAPGGENGGPGVQSGGPGGQGGSRGMGNLAAALAEKLSVDETKVSAALQEVMQADRPDGNGGGTPPSAGAQPGAGAQPSAGTQPGGQGQSSRDATIAKALAEKLGLDESKVSSALAEVRSEQQANRPDDGGAPAPQASASA